MEMDAGIQTPYLAGKKKSVLNNSNDWSFFSSPNLFKKQPIPRRKKLTVSSMTKEERSQKVNF